MNELLKMLPGRSHLLAAGVLALVCTLIMTGVERAADPLEWLTTAGKYLVMFVSFFFVIGISSVRIMESRGYSSRVAYLLLGAVWGLLFLALALGWMIFRACVVRATCTGESWVIIGESGAVGLLAGLMAFAFAMLAYVYRALYHQEL